MICNGCGKAVGPNETMYITENYRCICKECSAHVKQRGQCCHCKVGHEKDKMISCEYEGKDAYICEKCLLNDRAKVSRGKTDWKIGDAVYVNGDRKKGFHKGVIVAKHSDGIHHIVEYEGSPIGVFKEDLSKKCFTKEYQWIDNAFIDAGLDVMAQHQRTITKNDIDTLKKCLIHHMPNNG